MKADNGIAIPWGFVQSFAGKLRHATAIGFHGSYSAYYSNPTAQMGVMVTLTVIGKAIAAAA